ncbi:LLM class flavin-dependent oxidoreductase [Pseudomonas sp. LRF_L74]|uniref:LLM class flavin-dependent oxidoreductase n=1 Tax=Pseudomonas sp. LRF_L74 TaxID=3369422 RepID=UPI003F6437E2
MNGGLLHLNAFLMATGHHVAGWRHPLSRADGGLSLEHYLHLAQTAERGCFDAIFLSDTLAMLPGEHAALSRMSRTEHFEPLTLLAALAARTRHIGLIATATTSYNGAEQIAAAFASLERLSGGRCGWNLVTSSNAQEARNFGRDQHFLHADRYRMAERFHQRVQACWQAPERAPVQVCAGDSEAGREFAARHAEVVFTAQPDLQGACLFYQDIKARAARHGRSAQSLKVMPGILPIVGRTRAEAEAQHALLQSLVDPRVGLSLLADVGGGSDLSQLPLDGPLPDLPLTESGRSRQQLLLKLARTEGLSIRQLYLRMADARGHLVVVGSAQEIAEQMETWFRLGAADGFNVMPAWLPGGLEDFVDLVVPELRRRGLVRDHYVGRTLREHLGLAETYASRERIGNG